MSSKLDEQLKTPSPTPRGCRCPWVLPERGETRAVFAAGLCFMAACALLPQAHVSLTSALIEKRLLLFNSSA